MSALESWVYVFLFLLCFGALFWRGKAARLDFWLYGAIWRGYWDRKIDGAVGTAWFWPVMVAGGLSFALPFTAAITVAAATLSFCLYSAIACLQGFP